MTAIDIIILVILAAGALMGFRKGFIKQLASLLGLVVGLLAARALYGQLAEKLCPTVTESLGVAQMLAFALIWLAVPLIFALVASLLTRAMEAISLGGVNRLLGLVLGTAKYGLFICLLAGLLEFLDTDNVLVSRQAKNQSRFYYPMVELVNRYLPLAREVAEPILEGDSILLGEIITHP